MSVGLTQEQQQTKLSKEAWAYEKLSRVYTDKPDHCVSSCHDILFTLQTPLLNFWFCQLFRVFTSANHCVVTGSRFATSSCEHCLIKALKL